MKYAIMITPDNKEIELRTLESTDGNAEDFFFSILSPIANIDDFPVYSLPLLSPQGEKGNEKFFLCTSNDTIEIEGIAIIPIINTIVAQGLMNKLKDMIEWQ